MLQEPDLNSLPGVEAYLVDLRALIEFLESVNENTVCLYSYERTPSIDYLLDVFAEGFGANDWASRNLGIEERKAVRRCCPF